MKKSLFDKDPISSLRTLENQERRLLFIRGGALAASSIGGGVTVASGGDGVAKGISAANSSADFERGREVESSAKSGVTWASRTGAEAVDRVSSGTCSCSEIDDGCLSWREASCQIPPRCW